jgi:hypothetical protein
LYFCCYAMLSNVSSLRSIEGGSRPSLSLLLAVSKDFRQTC